jgi:acetyltransferase-like isoleucine patch superfamily enzyme
MKTKIIIIGGKGTAVVVAEQIIDAIERFGYNAEILGFAFDDPTMDHVMEFPILCHSYEVKEKYAQYDDVKFLYLLYRSDLIKVRSELRDSFNIPREKYLNFIHPTAYVARSVKMGYGNIILSNCVFNSNAQLGSFNTFNVACLVGHDTKIGDSNFCAAHTCIGSNLNISDMNFFGINCCVKNKVVMGNCNLIGQCANVVKNVENDLVLVGNPAKPLIK